MKSFALAPAILALTFSAACTGPPTAESSPPGPASAAESMPGLVPASKEITAEIKEAHQLYVKALMAGDSAALRSMFDSSYVAVRSNGQQVDLEQTLALIKLSYGNIEELTFNDESVMMLGPYPYGFSTFRQAGTVGGQHYSVNARALDVFTKKDGKWVVVFTSFANIVGTALETLPSTVRDN